MSDYLITGGAGFIGSHLAEALLAAGHGVRILDDLSTGRRENVPAGSRLLVGEVTDPAAVAEAMAGVTGCFHLAAIASVARGNEDWPGTHRVNQGGSVQVLDAARRAAPGGGPAPVVFASSAAAYGDNPRLPLVEEAERQPINAYGADKLGSELHLRVAALAHAIPTLALRFFNVYGPRQDPSSPYSGVISLFMARVVRGLPLEIHGDGLQSRDFVYVGDVVRFLLAAMTHLHSTPTGFAAANVCTGQAVTILELAQTLVALTGHRSPIRHGTARANDIRHSLGEPGHAARLLGVTANISLTEGLRRTLASLTP